MATSAEYRQLISPDGDGTCQWASTGANHYTEVDEDPTAPSTADYVSAAGVPNRSKIEQFTLASPNLNNLEGGFDRVAVYVYATVMGGSTLNLDIRAKIKGAWTAYQGVDIPPGWDWHNALFYNFCCDRNDGVALECGFRADSGMVLGQGIYIACVYVAIQASDILTVAQAKLSAQLA